MQNENTPRGKIARGIQGQSEISNADVERRAEEIALTEHPDSPRVRAEDREQAQKELQGQDIELSTDDARGETERSIDPTEAAVSSGEQTPTHTPDDDQNTEHLTKEGLEEAEHDERRTAQQAPEQGMSG